MAEDKEGKATITEDKGGETHYPDVVEQFAELLSHYKLRKGVAPENIAAHILETGSTTVFDNPAELQKALTEWADEIAATYRAKILDRWFKKRKIFVPPEVLAEAEMTPTEKQKREEKEKDAEAKFAVDTDTGLIRAAVKDEKPLTWSEAERVSTRVKKDLGSGDKGESPFILDAQGKWQINPKAKIGSTEAMAFQVIQRQQETGQPVNPIESLSQEAQRWTAVKAALGIGGGSTEIDELKAKITELTAKIDTQREQQLKDQITALSTKIDNLEAGVGQGKAAETRWGVFGKALEKADTQMTGLRGDIRAVAMSQRKGGASLPELSEEQRKAIGKKIKKAVEDEQASRQLADELWPDL